METCCSSNKFIIFSLVLLSFPLIYAADTVPDGWPRPAPGVVCPETSCTCPWGEVKAVDSQNCTVCACKVKPCPKLDCAAGTICRFGREKNADGCLTCRCKERKVCKPFKCSPGFPECPKQNGFFKLNDGCPSCRCRTHFCSHIRCENHCPFGYFRDEFGCNNCSCLPNCTQLSCDTPCEPKQEYETDDEGCPTCDCKPIPSNCTDVECEPCSDGFVFKDGCRTCECKGRTAGIIDYSYLYEKKDEL